MERRIANAFPGPAPPPQPSQAPYYHNNNNPHQIHRSHHHVSAVGFHQYPQNDNREHRFNQPHFDNQQRQQQQPSMIVDAPPLSSGFSPCDGGRKRRSLSSTPDPTAAAADGCVAKLYVAPLPKTAMEDDIRQVFEKYGNVTEIILPKDKMRGERAAYCFVKYRKLEEGDAAIAALTDQFTFPGEMSPVRVRYAGPERERIVGASTVQIPDKLYVRCLNKQTTRTDVHEVFCRFGVIEDIYMAVDDMKVSRGFAFVQFARKEMALAAIKGLNGVFTMRGSDQPLIVRFADPKKPRLGEPRSNFNAPPAMQQFDPNWHPQPYPQWGNKESAAPGFVDFASQPNHFPHQNAQAVSGVQKQLHQGTEKHQKSETANVETTRSDGQRISGNANVIHEDQNTEEFDWSEHICPDGNKYYFNCVTCESTWEKPDEYSMFERWFDEQIRLQDEKTASPALNSQSQDAVEQTTKLQQQSLSKADEENTSVNPVVTRVAVETTCP